MKRPVEIADMFGIDHEKPGVETAGAPGWRDRAGKETQARQVEPGGLADALPVLVAGARRFRRAPEKESGLLIGFPDRGDGKPACPRRACATTHALQESLLDGRMQTRGDNRS